MLLKQSSTDSYVTGIYNKLKLIFKIWTERPGLLTRIDSILQNESLQSFVQSNLAFSYNMFASELTVEKKLGHL
jgi:hypothetical protein